MSQEHWWGIALNLLQPTLTRIEVDVNLPDWPGAGRHAVLLDIPVVHAPMLRPVEPAHQAEIGWRTGFLRSTIQPSGT